MAARNPDERRTHARNGGLAAAANMTPEQRRERARIGAKASHETRRRRREGLALLRGELIQGWKAQDYTEAQIAEMLTAYGLDEVKNPNREQWTRQPVPSIEELDPYLAEVDRRFPEGGLSNEDRKREAVVLMKLDRARAIDRGLDA